MLLIASVVIRRSPEEVWSYLGNVDNVANWDRGVAGVETNSNAPAGVGFEFDTLARSPRAAADKDWGKMSYRITDIDPVRGCTIQLTSKSGNARFFKSAEWRFRVEPAADGSTVHCVAEFRLRLPWIILAPVFLGMKKAIRSDLEQLKKVLENPPQPSRS
jgi:uncharacterized protein YndB with AHSA1/START domain